MTANAKCEYLGQPMTQRETMPISYSASSLTQENFCTLTAMTECLKLECPNLVTASLALLNITNNL